MQGKTSAEALLEKYQSGQCTPEEKAVVESWHLHMLETIAHKPDIEVMNAAKDRMWQNVADNTYNVKRIRYNWFYYAASVLLIITGSLAYWKYANESKLDSKNNIAVQKPVIRRNNRAVLILADGRKVVLDQKREGLIACQGKISIKKNSDGTIEYQKGSNNSDLSYNTIAIPRGEIYHLVLSDGTKIWLNSASSIRFPVAFNGKNRAVELSGEAYFEVAKNKLKPFVVTTANQSVEVLGTHFNVCAYNDDHVAKTTLLEGSVKIKKDDQVAILKPGQQALNASDISALEVNTVDNAESAIAWKNGYFTSSHESIYSVMRKISRWYDVEIEYRGDFSKKFFGGTISKFKSVEEILSILELTGSVHFKIEGRKIILMP